MTETTFFSALANVVAESAPYLVLGFLAAGLLRGLLPPQRVYALLGENNLRSVLLASAIGVPLPLCSCSVIPTATGLRQSGAGKAATTSFLISTPETGVDSISITWALMDPIMTIARPVAAFATALFTGGAVRWLERDDEGPAAVDGPDCCSSAGCSDAPQPSARARVAEGIRYAFGPLFDDLAVWLVGGFILAAAVAALIPDGFFTAIAGGWLSSLIMMLLATPVYICASAATPLAAAMILKGLDPGAALVFLLVGPATNVTTILVVLRFLGRRVLVAYLLGVVISALAFGAAVNGLYGALAIDPGVSVAAPETASFGPVETLSAMFLAALLLVRAGRRLSARPAAKRESEASTMLR